MVDLRADQREAARAGRPHRPAVTGAAGEPRRGGPAAAGLEVKPAILMLDRGVDVDRGTRRLAGATGGCATALEEAAMKVLGMISGTSHDGIDVAVVDFRWTGDVLTARSLHADSAPYRADAARPARADPATGRSCARRGVRAGHPASGRRSPRSPPTPSRGGPVDLIVLPRPDGVPLGRRCARAGHAPARAGRPGSPSAPACRSCPTCAPATSRPAATAPRSCRSSTCCCSPVCRTGGGAQPRRHLQHDGRRPGGGARLAFDIGPANALDRRRVVRAPAPTPTATTPTGTWPRPDRCDDGLLAVLLAEPYYALPAPKSTGKELSTPTTSTQPWRVPASTGRQRPGRHAHRADRADGRRATSPPGRVDASSSPAGAATTRW